MRDFDQKVKQLSGVYFYSRYVDDIIVVTKPDLVPGNFKKEIKNYLRTGLLFNNSKSKSYFIDGTKQNERYTPTSFDYLGYNFKISGRKKKESKFCRDIIIDISSAKIKKIKTRISNSFRSYSKDKNYKDLFDRIKLLPLTIQFLTGIKKEKGKWEYIIIIG